ncbi:hypothetical protein ACQKLP_25830 [Chitinophaga sp. NPDC101104]|uniref:hypothetical protein n=1 Tax=Chitinophaga sp. NPDC101104 TaxID=3390561 RepID=UPI003D07EE91
MNRRLLRWWPLLLLFSALRSAGQDALRKRVSLPSTVITAGELRKEISRQTGLQFSFGSNTIRPGQLIRLPQKNYTAKSLLDEMQQQLKADYRIYEDHIIFTKRNKAATEARNGNTSADNVNARKEGKASADGKLNSPKIIAQNGKKGTADRKSDPAGTSTGNAGVLQGKKSAQDGKSNSQNMTAQIGKKGAADRKSDPVSTSTDKADELKGKHSQDKTAQNGTKSAADERTSALSDSIISKTSTTASPNEQSAPPQLNGAAKPDKPASKQNTAPSSGDLAIGGTSSNQLSLPLPFPTAHADERIRQRAYRLVPERRPAPQTVTGSAPAIRERKSPFDINNGIFARYTAAGIEATEYFPANGAFKAGVSILHGIIGYSSNGTYGSLRYGAGTRWTFSERWHVQASFTTGIVEKKLESDSGIIIQKTIDVRERLHRIGLQAERTLGKRWGLVGGLSWNMLNRTNTDNGTRLSPGDRIFDDPVPEEGYRAMKPFYTISSKFSEGNKTWKDRWIGVHVGLYFRL